MSGASAERAPGGLRKRVVRNITWLGGSTGLAALFTMAATAVNARALPVEQFGMLIVLQASTLLVAGITAFSTQQPVIKLGMAALSSGDDERFEWLVTVGLIADAISAALACIIAVSVILLAPRWLGIGEGATGFGLVFAGCLLLQGYKTAEGIFRALDRFDLLGRVHVVIAGLFLAASLALWVVEAPFISYCWLFAAAIAAPSVAQLAFALLLFHRRGNRLSFRSLARRPDDLREFVAYCWTTSATGTFDTIRTNGDSPAVAAVISLEAAAVYSVAKQLAGVIRKANVIYASVLFPELALMAARREVASALQLLKRAIRATAVIMIVVTGGAAVFGSLALTIIFGPPFAEGHWPLVVLTAAAALQMLSATYSMYVQAFIGPVPLVRVYAVAVLAFLIVIWPLLSVAGVVGAALGQLVFVAVLTIGCRHELIRGAVTENA